MKQYLDLINHVLTNGRYKEDRTGTGCYSVLGYQMRFDLSNGEFPLLTTKKMFTKGAIEELLWFLRGSTNVLELQEVGVRFWDSWVDDEGTIGHGYGKQFRSMERFSLVKPKIYEALPIHDFQPEIPEPIYESDVSHNPFKVGSIMSSPDGDFKIIERIYNPGTYRTSFKVCFLKTGTVKETDSSNIRIGSVRDVYARTVANVGYYGDYDKNDPHVAQLKDIWRAMIHRCYNENNSVYGNYGRIGVHVEPNWHSFANFQKDVKQLPNWVLKLEYPDEYSLDKDYLYASNRYGRHTCCWANKKVQMANLAISRYFTAKSPLGTKEFFTSPMSMVKEYGLDYRSIIKNLNKEREEHKGWSEFEYFPKSVQDGYVPRYDYVDQVKTLIANLKHDPFSRRHVMSLWDAVDVQRTTLPPCHGSLIEFQVVELTEQERSDFSAQYKDSQVPKYGLSSLMVQRSGDIFLGIPVNIASYSLFTLMVAQVCGYHPMEFIHTIGDAHIYSNHMEQVHEQLSREPRPMPKMRINPEVRDLFAFKFEDFTLEGYDPWPQIRGKVAV